jgi:lipopolysaccharide transport system ATP-binding protein
MSAKRKDDVISSTDDDAVIKVENASKKFSKSLTRTMIYGMKDIGRNIFHIPVKSDELRKDEFWALKDISFELRKGETLGVIGANGSGKSTLLKLLNGIYMPDAGKITINGKVGALIQIGAGFNPMLTGRENIYVNASILGMSKEEVDEKFDSIVEFADIGDFLDMPIKNYSSGMYVRLGFAIAVHSEPDILLVDEVLAVGDSNFIIKSLNKVNSLIKEREMTVIFVSHSNTMVRAVCKKALYLKDGACKKIGNVNEVIEKYEFDCLNERRKLLSGDYQRIKSADTAKINQIVLLSKDNCEKAYFKIGDFLKIRVYITAKEILEEPGIEIVIYNEKRECILNQISKMDNFILPPIFGKVYVDFSIEEIPFNVGVYPLSVKLMNGSLINSIDYHINARHITVKSGGRIGFDGRLWLNGKWEVSNE